MEAGNVSQTVYRRSILKQLKQDTSVRILRPGQEERCYAIDCSEGECVISCDVTLSGNDKDMVTYAIAQAVNELAAKGAEAKGLSVNVMLAPFAFESRLKSMMQSMTVTAKKVGASVLYAGAKTIPGLSTTLVSVTAAGTVRKEDLHQQAEAKAGQDIVLIGYIGLEGTVRIKHEKEEELAGRFIPAFLHQIERLSEEVFAQRAAKAAREAGAKVLCQITEGGIMAALWNLAEAAGTGLTVNLRQMNVKQETIEVCEQFHLNPYLLTSAGAMLAAADSGEDLVRVLEEQGIRAEIIGRLTDSNDRIIENGEESRFLDRPAPDEFYKIFP